MVSSREMVEMGMSVSLDKDTKKTNLKHNNRTMDEAEWLDNDHIDKDRVHLNNYLVQEDLKALYEKEFGEAQEKYNKKQKRKDRRIKNYYEHIRKSKRAAVQQEMILQIGDREDFKDNPENWNMANEVLEEWVRDFEKRNPNLKIYNAVIHNDESSPHLHINFVPVAGDYQRGMDKQVSFDRAILQQDEKLWEDYKQLQVKIKEENKRRKEKKLKGKYILTAAEMKIDSPFADWRKKEVGVLEKLLNERGIERVKPGRNGFEDMNEFKMMTDELEAKTKEIEKLNRQLQDKKIQTAAELKRFEQTQKLNEKIVEPEKTGGIQTIVVPQNYVAISAMPEIEVVKKRFGGFEADPEQIEDMNQWGDKIKKRNKELEKENKEMKGQLKEKDKRIQQLGQVIHTNKKEVEQRVDVRVGEERQAMASMRERDDLYVIHLSERLEDSERRAGGLEKENEFLAKWRERALGVLDKLGVREHFNNAMKRFERNREEGKEK